MFGRQPGVFVRHSFFFAQPLHSSFHDAIFIEIKDIRKDIGMLFKGPQDMTVSCFDNKLSFEIKYATLFKVIFSIVLFPQGLHREF